MKRIIFLAAILLTLGAAAQKPVHDANAVARPAKGFHAVEMSDGIDLYLTQGSEEAVAVSASSSEYRDKIVVEVVNGVLKIYFDRGSNGWNFNWGNRKLKAYVSVKSIDRLTASGGADVAIENELDVPALNMILSGGSDFKGRIITKRLDLNTSGGSDAYVSGRADDLKILCSGGSDVHAYELISNNCSVNSSGGSDVKITANQKIDANASGGSDIYYKGTASVSSAKSGGGSVKKVN
ncbi:DUF2807 domain-containing protein [Sediminibacterium roseum]|uniref:DUF2807 domain-containing protein n=1 Tax=Sediminibacterium roseum TaxID=1978412 RepID=A0ABW9ZT53_9BACT|nr:head GIN domain-containing protein [Sediminibacterium roseum]NCI50169.1 DUF2807 domain-containing protein [Sediminibacterium roseum]